MQYLQMLADVLGGGTQGAPGIENANLTPKEREALILKQKAREQNRFGTTPTAKGSGDGDSPPPPPPKGPGTIAPNGLLDYVLNALTGANRH